MPQNQTVSARENSWSSKVMNSITSGYTWQCLISKTDSQDLSFLILQQKRLCKPVTEVEQLEKRWNSWKIPILGVSSPVDT